MYYSDLPRVRDGALRFTCSAPDEQTSVLVGSAAWYHFLEQIDSFGFEDQSGRSFTARREQRDQQWYWYAYRKRGKRLRKVYLGKTDQLEPARLQAAARELADLPRVAQHTRSLAGPPSTEQRTAVFLGSTKLRIPATPANLLPRPRLTQLLRRPLQDAPAAISPNQRRMQPLLTVMTAPAGYGKTTLLAEWLQSVARRAQSAEPDHDTPALRSPFCALRSAWLALDPDDNDPKQFWRYLIAALQTSVPAVGRQALLLLQSPQPPALDAALTSLLDDLQHTPRAMVLVLDDYHVIDTPAIHAALATFLTHCPAHLHVVLASRTRPPLPFGRLRLRAAVTEIHAAELRLTDQEGFALLRREPRLADNAPAIATVLRTTEGWLAGVNLFLLALQREGDLETTLAACDGSHPYLTEYFCESVWRQQNPAIQAFLLHTAILENLSGSLCEAVTGRLDGRQLLAQIAQANLFLIALDQRPGWYRYQPLFAQALRRMLEQVHPEDVPALHRRAAAWYLEQHASGAALGHLLAGHCWVEAAQVLEQEALPMLQRGDTAEQAFAQLTPEQRRMALHQLSKTVPAHERSDRDDPKSLARMATRAELQQPGVVERVFYGQTPMMGGGYGYGDGLFGGAFMSSLAGAFVGSIIAQGLYDSFFDIPEYNGGDPSASVGDYGGAEGATAENEYSAQEAGLDFGDDFGGDFEGTEL